MNIKKDNFFSLTFPKTEEKRDAKKYQKALSGKCGCPVENSVESVENPDFAGLSVSLWVWKRQGRSRQLKTALKTLFSNFGKTENPKGEKGVLFLLWHFLRLTKI